jgi:hypothetical protein
MSSATVHAVRYRRGFHAFLSVVFALEEGYLSDFRPLIDWSMWLVASLVNSGMLNLAQLIG